MNDLTSASCLRPEFMVIHWLFSPAQHHPLNFKGVLCSGTSVLVKDLLLHGQKQLKEEKGSFFLTVHK